MNHAVCNCTLYIAISRHWTSKNSSDALATPAILVNTGVISGVLTMLLLQSASSFHPSYLCYWRQSLILVNYCNHWKHLEAVDVECRIMGTCTCQYHVQCVQSATKVWTSTPSWDVPQCSRVKDRAKAFSLIALSEDRNSGKWACPSSTCPSIYSSIIICMKSTK